MCVCGGRGGGRGVIYDELSGNLSFYHAAVSCGTLPARSNGMVLAPDKSTFGGTANVVCNNGFTKNGERVQLTCTVSPTTATTGIWTGPECEGKYSR